MMCDACFMREMTDILAVSVMQHDTRRLIYNEYFGFIDYTTV